MGCGGCGGVPFGGGWRTENREHVYIIYIYLSLSLSFSVFSLSLSPEYVYKHVHMYLYPSLSLSMYIYIYIIYTLGLGCRLGVMESVSLGRFASNGDATAAAVGLMQSSETLLGGEGQGSGISPRGAPVWALSFFFFFFFFFFEGI